MKIGGLHYKIIYTDSDALPDDSMGEVDWDNQLIKIDKSVSPEMKLVTLVHEILHCVNNQLEEKEVEYLAQSLTQIILDNYEQQTIKKIITDRETD